MDHTCKCHQCSLVDVVASKPNSIIPGSLSKGDYQSTFEHLYESSPSFQHLQPGFVNWRLRFPSHHLHGPRRVTCQIYLSNFAVARPRDLLPVSNNGILAMSSPTPKESESTSISAGNPFWVINALHCFHSMSWYAWIKRRYPCLPVYAIFLLANMLEILSDKKSYFCGFFPRSPFLCGGPFLVCYSHQGLLRLDGPIEVAQQQVWQGKYPKYTFIPLADGHACKTRYRYPDSNEFLDILPDRTAHASHIPCWRSRVMSNVVLMRKV